MKRLSIYNRVKIIDSVDEFERIMRSNEKVTLCVENAYHGFLMLLTPTSERFDDCFTITPTWIMEDFKGYEFIDFKQLDFTKLTQYHNEKLGANFIGMYNEIFKNLKCDVYIIENITEVVYSNGINLEDELIK